MKILKDSQAKEGEPGDYFRCLDSGKLGTVSVDGCLLTQSIISQSPIKYDG